MITVSIVERSIPVASKFLSNVPVSVVAWSMLGNIIGAAAARLPAPVSTRTRCCPVSTYRQVYGVVMRSVGRACRLSTSSTSSLGTLAKKASSG
jgi:hypothetical protein